MYNLCLFPSCMQEVAQGKRWEGIKWTRLDVWVQLEQGVTGQTNNAINIASRNIRERGSLLKVWFIKPFPKIRSKMCFRVLHLNLCMLPVRARCLSMGLSCLYRCPRYDRYYCRDTPFPFLLSSLRPPPPPQKKIKKKTVLLLMF